MAKAGRPNGSTTTSKAVVHAIQALADLKFNAADIERALGDLAPPDRTIRDIVHKRVIEDRSGAWSVLDAENPADALACLWVLRELVEVSEGRVSFLTRKEAERVALLSASAPDLPPLAVWRLGRLYLERAQAEQTTEDLDVYLAFRPWLGPDQASDYERAVNEGHIRAVAPSLLPGVPKRDLNYDVPADRRERLREIAERLRIDEPFHEGGQRA